MASQDEARELSQRLSSENVDEVLKPNPTPGTKSNRFFGLDSTGQVSLGVTSLSWQ